MSLQETPSSNRVLGDFLDRHFESLPLRVSEGFGSGEWLARFRSDAVMRQVGKPLEAVSAFEASLSEDRPYVDVYSDFVTAAQVIENAAEAIMQAKRLSPAQRMAIERSIEQLRADCVEATDRLNGCLETAGSMDQYRQISKSAGVRMEHLSRWMVTISENTPSVSSGMSM